MRELLRAMLRPPWLSVALAAVVVLLADLLFDNVPDLTRIESSSEGRLLKSAKPLDASDSIAIISIDEDEFLRETTEKQRHQRFLHAEIVRTLEDAGARVCLLDFIYAEPSEDPKVDQVLRSTLAQLKSLFVTATTSQVDLEDPQKGYFDPSFMVGGCPRVGVGLGEIKDSSPDGAFLYPLVDPRYPRGILPHAALCAVLQFQGNSGPITHDLKKAQISCGSFSTQVANDGTAHFQYTLNKTFPRDVTLTEFQALSEDHRRALFQDRLVIVGRQTLGDRHPSAFGEVDGIRILAQIANMLLSSPSSKIRSPSMWEHRVLTWFVAFCTSCIVLMSVKKRRFLYALGFLAVAWLIPSWLVNTLGVLESDRFFLTSGTISLLATWAIQPSAARWQELLVPTRGATVVFVDIRGSTEMITRIGAAGYGNVFKKFLDKCKPIVESNGGVIERPIGDAALLVFPSDHEGKHADRALKCAKLILIQAEKLGIEVGIGIESGILSGKYVIEGDTSVWSSFGEPINAAQRLQDISRTMPIAIALGPGAVSHLAGNEEVEFFSTQTLRGFSSPVSVYQIGRRGVNHEP